MQLHAGLAKIAHMPVDGAGEESDSISGVEDIEIAIYRMSLNRQAGWER